MTDNSTTAPAPITSDAQAAEMEQQLAAWRAQQAAEALAARNAKLQPLRDLVNADSYDALVAGLRDIVRAGTFVDDQSIDIHLRNVVTIMANLKAATA